MLVFFFFFYEKMIIGKIVLMLSLSNIILITYVLEAIEFFSPRAYTFFCHLVSDLDYLNMLVHLENLLGFICEFSAFLLSVFRISYNITVFFVESLRIEHVPFVFL